MDPDAALTELRAITTAILADGTCDADQALRMAELTEILDDWLSAGGTLPVAWQR